MEHPLEEYRKLGDIKFILGIDFEFYTRHYNSLNQGLSVVIDKEREGIHVEGHYIETGEFKGFITIYNFFEQEYSKFESQARSMIDKIILQHLDDKKQETLIKTIIVELQQIQIAISTFDLDSTNEKLKFILLGKVKLFCETLQLIYLNEKLATIGSTSKIQWLGKTNLLTTLFFELWKGQEKSKDKKTIPLLNCKLQKDLDMLLVNNFIDEKGEPLKLSTISDYLNPSEVKSIKRAKKGVRIEFEYPY